MRRAAGRLQRFCRSALCLVLAAALITGMFTLENLWVTARGQERTFDIGVNPESVIAVLDEDGLLTVSGSGDIRDFTADTAPFAGQAVQSLRLGADITAIGSYTFYNCPGITGTLELPAGLIRIGDRAFAGETPEAAAKPAFVRNAFTESLVTRKREPEAVESAAEEASGGPEASESEEQTETSAASADENASEASEAEAEEAAPEEAAASRPESGAEPESSFQPAAGEETDNGNRFSVERVTEQEIGREIFAPRQESAGFYCAPANDSFRTAIAAAGYTEAEALLPVTLDPGEGSCGEDEVLTLELPVTDGQLILPEAPEAFSAPESDGLYGYSFAGWTEYRDEADTVRAAGSAYETAGREELYFIANWTQTLRVGIQVVRRDEALTLTVPAIEGYEVAAYRWQTCVTDGEVPEEESLRWEDLPGETGQACAWTVGPEDENRWFRCVISVRRQVSLLRRLFAAPARAQELALNAVRASAPRRALSANAGDQVALNAGTYPGLEITGTMTALTVQGDGRVVIPECAYAAVQPDSGTVVFCGWTDGTTRYDPGDVVSYESIASEDKSLTATWNTATVTEVGTAAELYAALAGLNDTYSAEEALYRNVIRLTADIALDGPSLSTGAAASVAVRPCTLDGAGIAALSYDGAVRQYGDMRFTGLTLSADALCANAHRTVLTATAAVGGGMTLYGGNSDVSPATGSADLRVFGGALAALYGGGAQKSLSGGVRIFLGGGASAAAVYGGGQGAEAGAAQDVEMVLAQNAQAGTVYGSGENGGVRGAAIQLRGGTVGTLYGGGLSADVGEDGMTTGGGTALVFTGGTVTGDVYGGGKNGAVYGAAGTVNTIDVYGGTVSGNIFGGGSALVQRDVSVSIHGGTVGGSVYGGGAQGETAGSAGVAVSGGQIGGDVYGGGQGSGAALGGSASVTVTGGKITGGVYGGGSAGAVRGDVSVTVENVTAAVVYAGGRTGAVQGAGPHTLTLRGATVTGDVLGGGGGAVSGDVVVSVTGGSLSTLYGGGLGEISGGVTLTVTGGEISGDVFGGGKSGAVSGGTSVSLGDGVRIGGSVYGGGDGSDAGVTAGTTVEISAEIQAVAGNVYGGGKSGTVDGDTEVTVSGPVGGSVFGGGRGDSADAASARVTGGTAVQVTGGPIGTYSSEGVLASGSGNVYGGGEYAPVDGDTQAVVHAEESSGGPVLGGSLYGGGKSGTVGGQASAALEAGHVAGNVYGGGENLSAGVHSAETAISSLRASAGEEELTVVTGSVFGGGALGPVETASRAVITGGVMTEVYGGGQGDKTGGVSGVEPGRVGQTAGVTLTGAFTQVTGGVYGGGDLGLVGTGEDRTADAANTAGRTTVLLSGGTVGRVFGGGAGASGGSDTLGAVFGSTEITVTGGQIEGPVFGGGNFAYVTGDTRVEIAPTAGNVTVAGNVYGGGNLNRSPEDGYDGAVSLVGGSARVEIDGGAPGGVPAAGTVAISGAVLGGGHLTGVRGGGTIEIQNYGGEMTSLQRADLVKLRDSVLVLTGGDDVSDDRGDKAFSLSGLGDLRLADTTLTLRADTQELAGLGNYTVAADETWTASGDAANRSAMVAAPGQLIRVARQDGGSLRYGTISGVLTLAMEGAYQENTGMGVRVQAAPASDAGALVKSSAETAELVTGEAAGTYRFWRLGDKALRREITLIAGEAQNVQLESFATALNTEYQNSFYQLTDVRKTAGDFYLLRPEEENGSWKLPAYADGQNGGNSFGLLIAPSTDAEAAGSNQVWTNLDQSGAGSWILSAGENGAHWPEGQGTAELRGAAYPATEAAGKEASWTFTLIYDESAAAYTGGELDLTLQEYVSTDGTQEPEASIAEDTLLLHIILKQDENAVSQAAFVAAGRKFSGVTGTEPAEITANSAVTACFQSSYFGGGAGRLVLCREGASRQAVDFPEGTQVVLGDLSNDGEAAYYYCKTSGAGAVPLAGFSNLNAAIGGGYAGPADTSGMIREKLLFAVDFPASGGLAAGDYSLVLLHQEGEDPAALEQTAVARFTVTGGGSYALTLEGADSGGASETVTLRMTAMAPETDTRYADGATVQLTLEDGDGRTLRFPERAALTVDGREAVGVLRDKTGAVSFPLAVSAAGTETHTVTLDFTQVPEEIFEDFNGSVTLRAAMVPRVGLQVGSDGMTADASALLTVTFHRETETVSPRAIDLALKEDSSRLLEVSESAAVMAFDLHYSGAQSGDRLQAEILKKTGTTPAAASYSPAAGSDSWIALGTTEPVVSEQQQTTGLTVTVPAGTASGTYRIRVWICHGEGAALAEEVYNFIVQ